MSRIELPPEVTLSDLERALNMIDEGRAGHILRHAQAAAALRREKEAAEPEQAALRIPGPISDHDIVLNSEYGDMAEPSAYDDPSNGVKSKSEQRDN
jgi:hypothetical protein